MLSATTIFWSPISWLIYLFIYFWLVLSVCCEKSEHKVILFGKLDSIMTFFDYCKSLCLTKILVMVLIFFINGNYRKLNL